jgi:hypothetical protein
MSKPPDIVTGDLEAPANTQPGKSSTEAGAPSAPIRHEVG